MRRHWGLVLSLFSNVLAASSSSSEKSIRIGYLNDLWMIGLGRGAAINVAIQRAQNDGLLSDYNFTIVSYKIHCSAKAGTFGTLELLQNQNVDVIFGPVCSQVCPSVGYLMSYWRRPLFPEWCGGSTMNDPATYDTVVRIAGNYVSFSLAFKAVADLHGWTHIVVLSDDDIGSMCWQAARPFEQVFGGGQGNYTFMWGRISSQPTDEQLDDLLKQIRTRSRGLPDFRLPELEEHLILHGDYVFLCRLQLQRQLK